MSVVDTIHGLNGNDDDEYKYAVTKESVGGDEVVCWLYRNIELMQYTGLKDKNGVEIYEGDVLGGMYELVIQWCENCKSLQLFDTNNDNNNYCYQCNGDIFWHDVAHDEDLEVVGNIYENKDTK
jgi:uncharacterized phage protein (TIGR01671 family)